MRVVGVCSPLGPCVVSFEVGHGSHPMRQLFERGFVALHPLSAGLSGGDIVLTFLVRPATGSDPVPQPRRFFHEEPMAGEPPVLRQRVGAYAVVNSRRGVLGTVHSSLTGAPGTWALPGGGVDDGETPAGALVREVFEESGQEIRILRILGLDSDHWVGRSTSGVLEDFHALRIIYEAECETPSEPVVHDLGGSTERAGWVPWQSWNRLRWTISSRTILARYRAGVGGVSP